MKEILGGELDLAFKELNIKANKTFQSKHNNTDFTQVWELSDEDFEKICNIEEKDWKDDWGWWRSSDGSNILGNPICKIKINNNDITVYYDEKRIEQYIEDYLEKDYISEFKNEEEARNQLFKDYFSEKCIYKTFTEYCCNQWGASTEKNVCAIAVEIAILNNITMGELFNKYQG